MQCRQAARRYTLMGFRRFRLVKLLRQLVEIFSQVAIEILVAKLDLFGSTLVGQSGQLPAKPHHGSRKTVAEHDNVKQGERHNHPGDDRGGNNQIPDGSRAGRWRALGQEIHADDGNNRRQLTCYPIHGNSRDQLALDLFVSPGTPSSFS